MSVHYEKIPFWCDVFTVGSFTLTRTFVLSSGWPRDMFAVGRPGTNAGLGSGAKLSTACIAHCTTRHLSPGSVSDIGHAWSHELVVQMWSRSQV